MWSPKHPPLNIRNQHLSPPATLSMHTKMQSYIYLFTFKALLPKSSCRTHSLQSSCDHICMYFSSPPRARALFHQIHSTGVRCSINAKYLSSICSNHSLQQPSAMRRPRLLLGSTSPVAEAFRVRFISTFNAGLSCNFTIHPALFQKVPSSHLNTLQL